MELKASVLLEMENHDLKDMTLAMSRSVMDESEFRDYPHTGVAMQAHLRETAADAHRLIDWARDRSRPITVRPVKVAYWDSEIAWARQRNWPQPVLRHKNESDRAHPFGGFTMSGVGAKAGGPDYLRQYMVPRNVVEHTIRRSFCARDRIVERRTPAVPTERKLSTAMGRATFKVGRPHAGEVTIDEKFKAKRRAWARHPEILKNTHHIYLGDARKMAALKDHGPVHLVVTSPPYWNLKEYASDSSAQLGHIQDRAEFLEQLSQVWNKCFDALVPGGRMCVIVGDVCRSRKAFGRHLVEPLHAYVQVQCQETGFDPLAPIIWNKIANIVTEVAGNGSAFLGKPYEPNAIVKNDIEFILLFRKPGGYRHPTQEQRNLSLISKEDHHCWFQQVWSDVRGEVQRGHPAPYPVEIARRLIGMFSFVGDRVLDPFWGVGATSRAAISMYRSSVGFEIEPKYLDIGRRNVGIVPAESTIEFSM